MFDYISKVKAEERAKNEGPSEEETRQAEATELLYRIRRSKLLAGMAAEIDSQRRRAFFEGRPVPEFPANPPALDYSTVMSAKDIFMPKKGHDCAAKPEWCNIKQIPAGQTFIHPKTKVVYKATGSLYACSRTGKIHRCDHIFCQLQRPNIDAPGTKSCPVSRLDKGSTLDDTSQFARISHSDRTEMDNEDMRKLASQKHSHARPIAPAAASSSSSSSSSSSAAALMPGKRKGPTGAAARKRLAIDFVQDVRSETRHFQRETKQRELLKNQTPGHQEEVKRLANAVLNGNGIRESMKRAITEMLDNANQDLQDLIDNRSRRIAIANGSQLNSSSPGRSAANANSLIAASRPPPPINAVRCMSIINKNMICGVLSVIQVCLQQFRTQPTEPAINYFERCLMVLFTNVRRIALEEQESSGAAQKDPNLRKISLALFYALRDGMIGYRTVSRETGKYSRLRVCTASEDYAFRQKLSGEKRQTQEEARAADTDSSGEDDETLGSDDTGSQSDDDDNSYLNTADDIRQEQRFEFVPPHPGLRWFLPDEQALTKLRIDNLTEEVSSRMKKLRSVNSYFERMLKHPDPSDYCLDRMVSPIYTHLFVADDEAPNFKDLQHVFDPATGKPYDIDPSTGRPRESVPLKR